MEIDKNFIRNIASLARLNLNSQEEELYARQLNSILEFVAELNNLNLDDEELKTSIVGMNLQLSKDEVQEQGIREINSSAYREEMLKNAPKKINKYFKVPNVL